MFKRLTITYLIFQMFFSLVRGQENFAIYVTPTLVPPYSLKLSDYCKFGSQNLMVILTVKDIEISNMPVKLRIKMETVGVTIENPITINTSPIYLDGGTTSILFGEDLTDYFNIDNLIFKGYSKETYRSTGQLPEGFYKFTIEVLHFQTNKVISNQGTAIAWIAVGKPPVLKSPENNAQMGEYKGMPLTFTWLPSNVGSPVSTGTIQYKFEMWEMRIAGISPYTVASSMPVFHEYTTFNSAYTLYTDGLLMEPGMQYAWRVTASDISGFVPFEQDGHSEVRVFTYKESCDSVYGLTSSALGTVGIFSWQPEENHTSFNVEIRNPLTGWSTQSQTYENKAEFYDLKYGSTYELRVQSVCDGESDNTGDFSHWQKLTIPEQKPLFDSSQCPTCGCNDSLPNVVLTNFELRDLKAGDTIVNKTGTTRFILKTVEPVGNGTYKGIFLFWAEIWNLKFICEYWDLQVNTDDVIVNMGFESVYNPQFLLDVDAATDYLNNLANAINELTINTSISDTLSINGTITSIYVNAGDSVMAVTIDENGNVQETVIHDNVDDLSRTLIQGENGEEYVVTRNGEVMGVDEYKNTGGDGEKIDEMKEDNETNKLSSDETLTFTASQNQQYGFDSYTEIKSAIQSEYPTLQNGYRAPFKSVASYGTDKVGFSEVSGDVVFKDEMGIPALKSGKELTVRGSADGSEMALYAWQAINDSTEEIIGKLNIMSYDEQPKRVFIVPVNGASVPDAKTLEKTLNSIYSQAVTKWTVDSIGGIENVVFENGNMTHGGTSVISTYNVDQKTIVNAFENQYGNLESDASYLFFVENVQYKERSIAGYMPLQRQVGFIYDNPGLNIVAHELGHGAFNLYHTFSDENFIATEQTTNNLLDYKGGTELWKHQWNNIHDPENILFAFLQDEEEGEAPSVRLKYSFLTRNANAVYLSEKGKRGCLFMHRGLIEYSNEFSYSEKYGFGKVGIDTGQYKLGISYKLDVYIKNSLVSQGICVDSFDVKKYVSKLSSGSNPFRIIISENTSTTTTAKWEKVDTLEVKFVVPKPNYYIALKESTNTKMVDYIENNPIIVENNKSIEISIYDKMNDEIIDSTKIQNINWEITEKDSTYTRTGTDTITIKPNYLYEIEIKAICNYKNSSDTVSFKLIAPETIPVPVSPISFILLPASDNDKMVDPSDNGNGSIALKNTGNSINVKFKQKNITDNFTILNPVSTNPEKIKVNKTSSTTQELIIKVESLPNSSEIDSCYINLCDTSGKIRATQIVYVLKPLEITIDAWFAPTLSVIKYDIQAQNYLDYIYASLNTQNQNVITPDPDKNHNEQIDRVYGDAINDELSYFFGAGKPGIIQVFFIENRIVENWKIDSLLNKRKNATLLSYEKFTDSSATYNVLDSSMNTLMSNIVVTRNDTGISFNKKIKRKSYFLCETSSSAGKNIGGDLILVGVRPEVLTEETLTHELLHKYKLFDINLPGNMMHYTTKDKVQKPYFINKIVIQCETGTGKTIENPERQKQWLRIRLK